MRLIRIAGLATIAATVLVLFYPNRAGTTTLADRSRLEITALQQAMSLLRPYERGWVTQMVSVPTGTPSADVPGAPVCRQEVIHAWPYLLDTVCLPVPQSAALAPRVAPRGDWDSLEIPLALPWASGLLRATSDQFCVCLQLAADPALGGDMAAVSQYTPDEVGRLAELDQARYELARDFVIPTARQAQLFDSGRVRGLGGQLVSDLSVVERAKAARALGIVHALLADRLKTVTRYPWRYRTLGPGLYGESAASALPRTDSLQVVNAALLVRFYVNGDFFCMAVGRHGTISRTGGGAYGPSPRAVMAWFSDRAVGSE